MLLSNNIVRGFFATVLLNFTAAPVVARRNWWSNVPSSPFEIEVTNTPPMDQFADEMGQVEGVYKLYRVIIKTMIQGNSDNWKRTPTDQEKQAWRSMLTTYLNELSTMEEKYYTEKSTTVLKMQVRGVHDWLDAQGVLVSRFAIRMLRKVIRTGENNPMAGGLYGDGADARAARDAYELMIEKLEQQMDEQYGGAGFGYFCEKYWWTLVIAALVILIVALVTFYSCRGKPQRERAEIVVNNDAVRFDAGAMYHNPLLHKQSGFKNDTGYNSMSHYQPPQDNSGKNYVQQQC